MPLPIAFFIFGYVVLVGTTLVLLDDDDSRHS